MMNFYKKNYQRGMSLILPVLLLGITGISIFLVMAATTTGSIAAILPKNDATEARGYLFGCLDEYLVHLPSDPDFSPITISVFAEDCSAAVTEPVSGQKQIVLTVNNGVITRQLTALVQLSPLSILGITEP